MFPRSSTNTKVWVDSLQILDTAASHGDRDTLRLVLFSLAIASQFDKHMYLIVYCNTFAKKVKLIDLVFWGCKQRHVADFYISDFQSGLRALVKVGYGAKVAPFVKPSTVVDVTKGNKELSPAFLRWLADRKLSSDDRIMRLKEGYKELITTPKPSDRRNNDKIVDNILFFCGCFGE